MAFSIFIASERLNYITQLFSYILLPSTTDTQFSAILEPSFGHCNNAAFIYFNEPPNPLRKMYIHYVCNLDNCNSNKQLCIISLLEINKDNISTDLEKYLYKYAADYNRQIYFQSIEEENILRDEMDKVLLEKRLRKEAFENAEFKSKSIELEKEKEYMLIQNEIQLMSIEEERIRAFLLIEKERQIFEEEIEKQRIVLNNNKKKLILEIENKLTKLDLEAEEKRLKVEAEKRRKAEDKLMAVLEKEKKIKLKNDKTNQKLQKIKEEQDLENFLNSAIKENIMNIPIINRGYTDISENIIDTIYRFNKCNTIFKEFICVVSIKDAYNDAVTNTVITEKFQFTLDYLEIIVMDRLLTENIFEFIPNDYRLLIREIIKIIFAGIFDIFGKGKGDFRSIDRCYQNKFKLYIEPDLINKICTTILEIIVIAKNGDSNSFINKLVFPSCYEFMIKTYCKTFELLNKISNKSALDNIRRELSIYIFMYMFSNNGEAYVDIQMPLCPYVQQSIKFLETKFNSLVKKYNVELVGN